MKRALAIILCAAFLIAMFAISVSAAVAGDDPANQIKVAKGTAVIDGVKDDCYTAADKITTTHPNAGVESTNYATFEGYAVYDADALYLWGHITDPTLSTNGNSWDGDGIEIFLNFDLASGIGATDEMDPYGDGAMQFRAIPIPAEDQIVKTIADNGAYIGGTYEVSTTRVYDLEVGADMEKNPQNYFIKPDADNKGYTIEFRFPFPSTRKAEVKSGYAIGFGIQLNDAQDGNPTTVANRTGTIHSFSGENMEQGWQYIGSIGRAFFTDLEYVAPVSAAEPVPVEAAQGGGEAADVEIAPVVQAATNAAPPTGDSSIMIFVILTIALVGAVVISKRVIKNRV